MKNGNKKKVEWSKAITGLVILFFAGYGIWSGIRYYQLCLIAIEKDSMMPDATLAVTCVTTILAALMSYCLYQWGLKNSRNKYGIDSEGEPFVTPGPYSEEDRSRRSTRRTCRGRWRRWGCRWAGSRH